MATLAGLYGAGAGAELQALMDQAAADVGFTATYKIESGAGKARITVILRDAQSQLAGGFRVDHYADRVHWLSHRMRDPGSGMLDAMVRRLGPWYVSKGVPLQTFGPEVPGQLTRFHALTGFALQGKLAVMDLSSPAMQEWLAWKNAGGPEPQWHVDLAAG